MIKLSEHQGIRHDTMKSTTEARIADLEAQLRINFQTKVGDVIKEE